MYGVLAAGYADWPIIKQIAWLFGQIMNLIYNFLDGVFGIQNIGLCIILFTIIIYTLMIPLTIKQQKFSKMSAVMNPEVQKIQKKYEGKKDQASLFKQQEELQMVYDKYGTSPTGGCLPMLIQLPMLFALYPVVQNIPKYVKSVKDVYMPVVNEIMATDGYQKVMEAIGSVKPVLMNPENYDYTKADTLVNVLYKFQDATWDTLVDKLPSLQGIVDSTIHTIGHMNNFLGINIGEAPFSMLTSSLKPFNIVGIIMAIIIPVVAAGTQFLSIKLQPQASSVSSDDPMANSMKTMTYTMPLMSLFFCFTLPAGMGVYWCISAIVRSVQQIGINKYMSKIPIEDIIKKNQEQAAKKREKKGTKAEELNRMATAKTKNINKMSSSLDSEKEEKIRRATEHIQTAKPGTLASKAALVSRYNNNQNVKSKKTKDSES